MVIGECVNRLYESVLCCFLYFSVCLKVVTKFLKKKYIPGKALYHLNVKKNVNVFMMEKFSRDFKNDWKLGSESENAKDDAYWHWL